MNPVVKNSIKTFLVVGLQVCTYVRRILAHFTETLNPLGFLATGWQLEASASFIGCSVALRSVDHSVTLICFFCSHSIVALAICFRSLSC